MINWLKAHWKVVWWLLLVGLTTYFLWQRFDSITSGAANAIDIVIFLIWIALLTTPLFQEVSIFGVSFKKEIDNLRTEFKKQIINLRADIHNKIDARAEISQQIYLHPPPSDAELPYLKKQIQATVEEVLKSQDIQKPVPTQKDFTIPDAAGYLFSIRYTIEQELRRIWRQWQETQWELRAWSGQIIEKERPKSIFQITSSLDELGIITSELSGAIREVYRVCSPAIHGEPISQTATGFVKDVAPELIAILKSTEGNLRLQHKPKEPKP